MHMALALDVFLTFSNFYCGSSFTEYSVLSPHVSLFQPNEEYFCHCCKYVCAISFFFFKVNALF